MFNDTTFPTTMNNTVENETDVGGALGGAVGEPAASRPRPPCFVYDVAVRIVLNSMLGVFGVVGNR